MTAAAVQTAREVLLIDLSAIFRACWHANADGELSVAFNATLDGVRRCIGQRDALVAVCCDGRGSFRKELYPEYKANREKQPESMYDVLRRVKERLNADGLLLWECDTFEADDVIATAVDCARLAGHPVCIASHDKDLAQLMGPQMRFLKTSTWEEMDEAQLLSKFGVKAGQMVDYLALTGDKSDNIPGVPGVGPKTAADLLNRFGSWSGILDQLAADASKVGTPNLTAKLANAVEAVALGQKLIQLRMDAPIEFKDIYEVRKQKPIAKGIAPMPNKNQVDFDDARISPPPSATATTPQPRDTPAPTVIDAESTPVPTAAAAPVTTAAPPPEPQPLSIVPREPTSFDRALEPQGPAQAVNLAARIHNARLYTWLANEDAVLAVIMRGREDGLPACIALETFRPVQGRMAAIWQYIVDRAQRDPNCEYLKPILISETKATWEGKHRKHPGPPLQLSVTIDEMQKTGLVKPNGAWVQRPAQMLTKEAGVRLARTLWPGATSGLYSIDELGGDE